jgi:hypothetical protein
MVRKFARNEAALSLVYRWATPLKVLLFTQLM